MKINIDRRSNFTLTFGAFNRSSFEAGRVIVDTNVKIIHPNYNSTNYKNDIALIRLPLPLFQTSSSKF
jgi:Trypsin